MSKPVNPSLFCFDFDNTLVNGHFHNALWSKGVAPGKASAAQIQALIVEFGILNRKELLKTFRQILKNGDHIAITTWSDYPEVVMPTLRRIGLNAEEIKQIHIESGLPEDSRVRKSEHIARAKAHFGITNNKQVFLIDDDERNVLKAIADGQQGIHVKNPQTDIRYLKEVQSKIKSASTKTLRRTNTVVISPIQPICKLEQIINRDAKCPSRHILSLNGLPFYKSSGENSGFAGTWFPFFGVLDKDVSIFQKKGTYIKPEISKLPSDVAKKMTELFPSYGSADAGRQLLIRFSTVPCLLISSWIGGGLWNEERGINLKKYLMEKYPAFYRKCPVIEMQPAIKTLKTLESVNRWLCDKANVANYQALTNKMLNKINEIQFRDGVMITRDMPKREVRFAQLDTQQGKRLFQLRHALQTAGKRQAPKRTDGERPLARFLRKNPRLENKPISSPKPTMWVPMVWSALLSVALWALNAPVLLIAGIGIAAFTGVNTFRTHQASKRQEAKSALTKDSHQWLQANQDVYEIGYRSKDWIPFLTSHLNPQTYFNPAYQIGLEEALEGKQQRKLKK